MNDIKMNDIKQNFFAELHTFDDIDILNINSFDSSLFFSLSNVYYTSIDSLNINIFQCSYYNKLDFLNNDLSNTNYIPLEKFFLESISKNINNIYLSKDLTEKNIRLINNSIVFINHDISTCLFSKTNNFNYIQPFINNLTGCALRYSQISSIDISSDNFLFGPHQLANVGYNQSLINVDLSKVNSLSSIPHNFLEDNDNLISVSFPNNVKKIEKYAFSNCYSLKNIIIPDSTEIVEDFAFSNCKNLESIELGKKLNVVGHYIFNNTPNLKNIIIRNSSSILDLNLDYCNLNYQLSIFVSDNFLQKYKEFVSKKYGGNAKYFYYKISELEK